MKSWPPAFQRVRWIAKSNCYVSSCICLSVHPHVATPTRRIFMKFGIWIFLKNLSKLKFHWNLTRITGTFTWRSMYIYGNHHHHKHQGLDPLNRSVSKVTTALSNVSSVFQLFSFLVCSGMISEGFGFVAFFASVKASSVCIHLSCLVCLQLREKVRSYRCHVTGGVFFLVPFGRILLALLKLVLNVS